MTKSFPWQKAAAVAGVAGFALLILPSLLGGKKDGEGSESGGFQLPSIFPAGSGAGEAAPAGANTYNISFPNFPGFPDSTKKSAATQEMSAGTGLFTSSAVNPARATFEKSNLRTAIAETSTKKSSGGMGTTYFSKPSVSPARTTFEKSNLRTAIAKTSTKKGAKK